MSLTTKHVIYADVSVEILYQLLSICIKHGYVPSQFSYTIIVPVVKNTAIKSDVIDNHRPIFLVHVFC